MNYENMSDFEINKRVAESIGFNVVNEQVNEVVGSMWVIKNNSGVRDGMPDYCNNPRDAWPLIEQVWSTLMSVTSYDYGVGVGESKTTIWDASMHMYGDSKLRAACIVYLMMKEAK